MENHAESGADTGATEQESDTESPSSSTNSETVMLRGVIINGIILLAIIGKGSGDPIVPAPTQKGDKFLRSLRSML